METKIPNLRKLIAKTVPACQIDKMSDDMVVAISRGLKVKPEFSAKVGGTDKNPRPGTLYISGPMLKGSDGQEVKGANVEVGALRPLIDQLVAIEFKLRNGEIDLPEGFSLQFANNGEILRAVVDK